MQKDYTYEWDNAIIEDDKAHNEKRKLNKANKK